MAIRFERDENGVLYLVVDAFRIQFSEEDFEALVAASAREGPAYIRNISQRDEWTPAEKQVLLNQAFGIYNAAHQEGIPSASTRFVICKAKNGDNEYLQSDDSWSLDRDNARKYVSEEEARKHAKDKLWTILNSHGGVVIVDPDSVNI